MGVAEIRLFAPEEVPLIKEGDDIVDIILDAVELKSHDIVVIASTIMSKSEGRAISLDSIRPCARAVELASNLNEDPRFMELVLQNSRRIIVERPILLTEMPNGYICIKAGIDRSNVKDGKALLLPADPDKSAKGIHDRILERTGKRVSIIISDTSGRAFRMGQTAVAVGCAGIGPLLNWVGMKDLYGHELEITEEAVADELAGASNLLTGEGNGGKPIVVVRGLDLYSDSHGVAALHRKDEDDVIKRALLHV